MKIKNILTWSSVFISYFVKLKEIILTWIFLLIPIFLFIYEILNKEKLGRIELMDLQLIEFMSVSVFLILIGFFGIYQEIKNYNLRFILFFVIFLLITTVQYEFYSIYLLIIHLTCYLYLVIALFMITKELKNKDRDE